MKLTRKNILRFSGIYFSIILVCNLIYVLTIIPSFEGFILTIDNLFHLPVLTTCSIWPFAGQGPEIVRYCTYNFSFILLNIYFAVVSYFLVFKHKLPINYWIIGFTFLNILILMFIRLKDFLYAGI